MGNNVDAKAKAVAYKLRKIRELMNLTREEFCEPLKENVEYWGMIERGEQQISLLKLLQVCEVYQIPIEKVVQFDFQKQDTADLIKKINSELQHCNRHQLQVIQKFITEIVAAL